MKVNDNSWFSQKSIFKYLEFVTILGGAYTLWMIFMIVLNTESPIVVVLTGSIEPSFNRGDILVVSNYDKSPQVGDIVVYRIIHGEIPIVHRALEVVEKISRKKNDKEMHNFTLSKGDNNFGDDRPIYYDHKAEKNYLFDHEFMGRVRFYFPLLGYITILFNESPLFKYTVIGLLLLGTLATKEIKK